jgi:hypothetical protein
VSDGRPARQYQRAPSATACLACHPSEWGIDATTKRSGGRSTTTCSAGPYRPLLRVRRYEVGAASPGRSFSCLASPCSSQPGRRRRREPSTAARS